VRFTNEGGNSSLRKDALKKDQENQKDI
jgi:hypothetical protein